MKIIISHDIDHISAWEHKFDLIIPKFIIRMHIELILGKISFKEYFLRYKNIFRNKWNNINELMLFNKQNNVPATFFIGVNNGLGLSYNIKLAKKWTKKIINNGFDCGVHGIAYDNFEDVKKEYNIFKEISGLDNFGIRMHYLRNDDKTLQYLADAGYDYDTTDMSNKDNYKVGNMLEFPLHIMEGYELEDGKKWQTKTTKQALASSFIKIKDAEKIGIKYLTILFHDRYFDNSFLSWKKWYEQIINYCNLQGYEFVSFKQAIKEIEN